MGAHYVLSVVVGVVVFLLPRFAATTSRGNFGRQRGLVGSGWALRGSERRDSRGGRDCSEVFLRQTILVCV